LDVAYFIVIETRDKEASTMTLVQEPLQDPVQQQQLQDLLNGNPLALSPVKDATITTEVKPLTAPETRPQDGDKTKPRFVIEEHPVDQVRDIKVGIIGGGMAGVTAAVLLPAKLPGLDLRVYEKNADLVGQHQSRWNLLFC
jgi:hypothetical protein